MKKEYIDGKEINGLKYDFKLLRREFKKLQTPKEVYNPCYCPFEQCKWFVNLSDRSTGKTTNWLLFGMLMNRFYGTVIQYVRQSESQIAPKNSKDLFDTILDCGYIEKITNGQYNGVCYKSKRWYYAIIDDEGNVVEKSPKHFMMMLSIDKHLDYKSVYNCPTGDIIIFDEFIGNYYYRNEFVNFNDLLKTIIRERQSPIIVMLANVIEKNSQYFNELEIYENIQRLRQGENEIITSERGTKIYVEILESGIKKHKGRNIVNKLFFGWKNPLISSITGEDWAIGVYQHIPENANILLRGHYIQHNGKIIALDLMYNEEIGVFVGVHFSTMTYDDSIIYTLSDIEDKRFRYRMGYTKSDKKLWEFFRKNKFFYASNDLGSLVENYVKNCALL